MKCIAKNAIYNTLYKALNAIFPMIALAYVSHVMLAEHVGMVASAQNIAQYLVVLAPLGLMNYGTKRIAGCCDDKEKRDKTFTELFLINAVSTTICCLVYYTLILFIPFFSGRRLLLSITGLAIVFNYLNVEWFFQGIEEYGYIAIRSLLVKGVSLTLIILLVNGKDDYLVYAFIYSLGIAGNSILNLIRIHKIGVRINTDRIGIHIHIKPLFILLLNSLAIELYTLFDTTMLGIMCDDKVVAYYTNSTKIVRVLVTILTALCGVLMPRLSRYKNQEMDEKNTYLVNNTIMLMIYMIFPSMLGIFMLAKPIIFVLFGPDFLPSEMTLKIASMLILAMGLSYMFGTQIMITYNMEKLIFMCSLLGAVSNIVMNTVLIPRYHQDGAITASVFSEYLVMFATLFFARKAIKIRVDVHGLLCSIIGCMGIGVCIILVSSMLNSQILIICTSVLGGMLIYLLIVFLFDKEMRRLSLRLLKSIL